MLFQDSIPGLDSCAEDNTPLPVKRRDTRAKDPTDELIRLACTRLQQPVSDDIHLATTWTKDIKTMAPEQQILTKKFINDIIFEGLMGTLHRNSVIIIEPGRSRTPSPYTSNSMNSSHLSTIITVPDHMSQNSDTVADFFSTFQ